MGHYLFFIDDSGTKEYSEERAYSCNNTRYFVFGGVLIAEKEAGPTAERFKKLKEHSFSTRNVEIKSNWLRIPHEREKHYLDVYGITEEQLSTFVENYYKLVCKSDVIFIAAVVDKLHMQEDYLIPWYAPAFAYEVLMQRVVREIVSPNTCAVTIDDMDGATPKGNQYKANLKKQHELLRTHGSRLQRNLSFAPLTSKVRFLNSSQSEFIQIADIVSYNVLRQFIKYGTQWEPDEEAAASSGRYSLQTYEWFYRIGHKFRQGPHGRIQGYGIVKVPMRKRIMWTIKKRTAP